MLSANRQLQDWLSALERRGPAPIALGLDRIAAVDAALAPSSLARAVISVAGTNGKGSVVACLDALLRGSGLRCVRYSSPHLLRFNERIVIDGDPVEDAALLAAFERVERARGETPLTYFEFTTLAAFELFRDAAADVAILEVGLGGRLDAVNLIDADVAVITSIGLDHQDYLGPDRASIGIEKAGIARAGKPLVLAEPDPPAAMLASLQQSAAQLWRHGIDFGWCGPPAADRRLAHGPWPGQLELPRPPLPGEHQWHNLLSALVASQLLPQGLRPALDGTAWHAWIAGVTLPGRLQRVDPSAPVFLDVAHNAHGAAALAQWLAAQPRPRHAVFALLADKDLDAVLAPLLPLVDHWYPVQLQGPRSRPRQQLAAALRERGAAVSNCEPADAASVWRQARRQRDLDGGCLLGFGSFLLVAELLATD